MQIHHIRNRDGMPLCGCIPGPGDLFAGKQEDGKVKPCNCDWCHRVFESQSRRMRAPKRQIYPVVKRVKMTNTAAQRLKAASMELCIPEAEVLRQAFEFWCKNQPAAKRILS